MTVKELEQKIKNESRFANEINLALSMNLDNVKTNSDLQKARESQLYLRGVLAGLRVGEFLSNMEYGSLVREVNDAYLNRERKQGS